MYQEIINTLSPSISATHCEEFSLSTAEQFLLRVLIEEHLNAFIHYLETLTIHQQYNLLTYVPSGGSSLLHELEGEAPIEIFSNLIKAWPEQERTLAMTRTNFSGQTVFHAWNAQFNQIGPTQTDFCEQQFKKLTADLSASATVKILHQRNLVTNLIAWNNQQLGRLTAYIYQQELAAIHNTTINFMLALNTDRVNWRLPLDIRIKILEEAVMMSHLDDPNSLVDTLEATQVIKNAYMAAQRSIDTLYARQRSSQVPTESSDRITARTVGVLNGRCAN